MTIQPVQTILTQAGQMGYHLTAFQQRIRSTWFCTLGGPCPSDPETYRCIAGTGYGPTPDAAIYNAFERVNVGATRLRFRGAPDMKTIDTLLKEGAEAGLLLNRMDQCRAGVWRVNWRYIPPPENRVNGYADPIFFPIGQSSRSAEEAMSMALTSAKAGIPGAPKVRPSRARPKPAQAAPAPSGPELDLTPRVRTRHRPA
jgi:hypothetical protein